MSASPKSKRSDLSLLPCIAFAAPSLLVILASLWPLELITLSLVCYVLAVAAFATFYFVWTLRGLFVWITTMAIVLSVVVSDWPLRAAYTLSRRSFERVAGEIRDGHPPTANAY